MALRRKRLGRTAAWIVVAAALSVGAATAAWAAADPSFFRSVETKSNNLKPFKKWNGAIARYSEEAAKEEERTDCDSQRFNTCHYQVWAKYLDGLKDMPKDEQIVEVNSWANQRKYITDPRNWGQKDYWATPGEFIARFGDCEDYAIIKYLSLKRLGFTDEELRVVAVKDMNLKVGHAVLVVLHKGKTLLLDNQIKKVVSTEIVRHYQPVFSINETAWWRHRAG